MGSKPGWEALVADKRKRQAEAIPREWKIQLPPEERLDVRDVPKECGLLTLRELQITELDDVEALLNNIAKGTWSSEEVMTAYYKRAIVAHQLTNCLTEIFVDRALARARELDRILKETRKVVGPLHGLPVSMKDQFLIKDLESTLGFASLVGNHSKEDALLVQILHEAGAVPFVKTNVPQTLMWGETHNLVFGRTLNPYNRKLTAGGSSGGEGALLAMKGSPLGIGTDVGGSIRIPAGFVGVYGLRPSYYRVPNGGCLTISHGEESVPAVLGPLSRSLSGVKVFMKAVAAARPWDRDPFTFRKAWDEDAYSLIDHGGKGGKKLAFAIMWDNGHIVPHPPVMRAMEETRAALIEAGHKVIDWAPFPYEALGKNLERIWASAGNKSLLDVLAESGEPVLPSMALDPAMKGFNKSSIGTNAYELRKLHKEKKDLREAHFAQWQETARLTGTGRPVDAIICPVAPFAAPPHGNNKYSFYTMALNSLDCTTSVFPVTTVDPKVDVRRSPHKFYNDRDRRNYESYDPESFQGAPVALQLAGRTLEEEAVIAMTEIVDEALNSHKEVRAKL